MQPTESLGLTMMRLELSRVLKSIEYDSQPITFVTSTGREYKVTRGALDPVTEAVGFVYKDRKITLSRDAINDVLQGKEQLDEIVFSDLFNVFVRP